MKRKLPAAPRRILLLAGLLLAPFAAPAAGAQPATIVVLGDSLSAGYGLDPGAAFPEQLEAELRARGHDVEVTNAGVSGDTASDGLARLEWSVPAEADMVIVELGANDALRGIDPAVTKAALSDIIGKLKARGQAVLLAGMQAPRNMGHAYVEQFDSIFPQLAADHDVEIYPFFLEGVAMDRTLNQPDGIHPTEEGVARIVEAILPSVEAMLDAGAMAD